MWLDHYSHQEVPGLMELHLGEMEAGSRSKNCAIFTATWPGWLEWTCSVTKEAPVMCLCQKEDPVYLTLRAVFI